MPNIPAPPSHPPRIRIGGPEEIVAAMPHLLGFHPAESVVAIGLRGRRARVCLALRVDLPAAEHEPGLAALVTDHLRRCGATAVILLIVTEATTPAGELPRPALVNELRAALGRRGVAVRDVLCARGARWWSYVCEEPACCPPEGSPVRPDAAAVLATATVAEGRVVHADREQLVATLAPTPVPDADARRRRFAATHARDRAALATEAGRGAVLAEIAEVVAARAERPAPLTDAQVVRFCVALTELAVRDACLRWLPGPLADVAEGVWLELVRAAAPPYAAAPAALLALHGYARGDGTFARIAADRAIEDEPGYAMAWLVHESLDRGLPPTAIQELGACVEPAGGDA